MLHLALVLPLVAQSWTVDDDGPADFPDVQAAVQAASDGDAILIQPGTYGPFTTGKALTLLGPGAGPKPKVTGESTVDGAAELALAGLDLAELVVRNVPGRARIDDCRIHTGPAGDTGFLGHTFLVESCGSVELTRSTVHGDDGGWFGDATHGLSVRASVVAVVDSEIEGGEGGFESLDGYEGGNGLDVSLASTVLVAGSRVRGGDGGPCIGFGGTSDGGHGISFAGSKIVIRGSSTDWVDGGAGCGAGKAGKALIGTDEAVASGVALGPVQPGVSLTVPVPAEPYLELGGLSAPGDSRRVRLYGPAGGIGVVAFATGDLFLQPPSLSQPLWLDPATIFALVPLATLGQDVAATKTIPTPADPALAGLSFTLQAGLPQPSGDVFLSNPTNAILRF